MLLEITNSGSSIFDVELLDSDGDKLDTLVYEVGDYSGTVAWAEPQSFLIVESDGTWSVSW